MQDKGGPGIRELSVREFYGKVWEEYADPRHHPITAHALSVQSRTVSEWIRKNRPRRVLDLGCGPAPVVDPDEAPLVVCADLVREMLLPIRQSGGYSALCLDARNLPFRDKSFDLVWCALLVDHIENLTDWIQELTRVLVPGGRIGMACWERARLPHERYPGNREMCYTTSRGEELAVSSHPNWLEALDILKNCTPSLELKSFPIFEDEYILQIASVKI